MRKISLLFLFVAALVSACKDDDVKLTVEQQLTASTNGWVIQSIVYTDPKDGDIDLVELGLLEECDLDDSFVFKSDKTLTIFANTKCDDSTSDSESGSWALNSDKTTLTLTSSDDSDTTVITITKLAVDANNIKGETSITFEGGSVDVKVTFKKK